jgi:hypothetical protein
MRFKGKSQRYFAVLSACCVVYFWGTWTLHSLLDDVGAREQREVKGKGQWSDAVISGKNKVGVSGNFGRKSIKDKPKLSSSLLVPDEPAQIVLPPAPSDGKFSACLIVMDDNHLLTEWLVSSASCVPAPISNILYLVVTVSQHVDRDSYFSVLSFHFIGLSLSYASSEASHRFGRSSKQNFSHTHFGSMEKTRDGYHSMEG